MKTLHFQLLIVAAIAWCVERLLHLATGAARGFAWHAGSLHGRLAGWCLLKQATLHARRAAMQQPIEQSERTRGDDVLSVVVIAAAIACLIAFAGDLQTAYAEHLAQQFASTVAGASK